MQQTVFAVVARAVNFKDHDRILTLITREKGTLTATAKGCRKPQSEKMPCAQPFVYGEYELAQYKGRWYVKTCQVREVFYNLRLSPDRLSAAAQATVAVRAMSCPEEENRKLFSLLLYTLDRLCQEQAEVDSILCFFFAKLLCFGGFGPEVESCVACGQTQQLHWFDAAEGGCICESCRQNLPQARPLSESARQTLIQMQQTPSAQYSAVQQQLAQVKKPLLALLLQSYEALDTLPLPKRLAD